MNYSIESAINYQYGDIETKNFYIRNSKFEYVSKQKIQFTGFQVNTTGMVMTPGYVMFDFDLINIVVFSSIKERMRYLQTIGCTTVITVCEIDDEKNFEQKLRKARQALINTTVDYLISVKVSLSNLTPVFVRKCKHYKVPIVFITLNENSNLNKVKWQEIKNETFQYDIHICPIWIGSKMNEVEGIEILNEILLKYRLPTFINPIREHEPLNKRSLRSLGIYPQKGLLSTGSDVDYLLFRKQDFLNSNTGKNLQPSVVVVRGKVLKAGENVMIYPGNGKEVIINLPRRFVPIEEDFSIKTID